VGRRAQAVSRDIIASIDAMVLYLPEQLAQSYRVPSPSLNHLSAYADAVLPSHLPFIHESTTPSAIHLCPPPPSASFCLLFLLPFVQACVRMSLARDSSSIRRRKRARRGARRTCLRVTTEEAAGVCSWRFSGSVGCTGGESHAVAFRRERY